MRRTIEDDIIAMCTQEQSDRLGQRFVVLAAKPGGRPASRGPCGRFVQQPIFVCATDLKMPMSVCSAVSQSASTQPDKCTNTSAGQPWTGPCVTSVRP